MAANIFSFKPAEVPPTSRGTRTSRYSATVEAVHAYLQEHADQQAVKVELGSVAIKTAVASFRSTIAKLHPQSLRLMQRGGELYIARR